ncbi:MAG: hypothetical protein J3T61_12665 [Candidatus Brocadiales bacterium]|nr:hypothetical protein [Candidatus Bathyanammoxibius sp.]
MSAFPDWEQYAVPQHRVQTGCIPTGYEMILRAAGVEAINFETFQDEFDLDKDIKPGQQPKNNFTSVADAVRRRYPQANFKCECFPDREGIKKLCLIEERIKQQQPVLISLALEPFGKKGWHIMPVVDSTDDELILLKIMSPNGSKEICKLPKNELIRIHDNYAGGKDVGYLDNK